jgi:hypothetical protein
VFNRLFCFHFLPRKRTISKITILCSKFKRKRTIRVMRYSKFHSNYSHGKIVFKLYNVHSISKNWGKNLYDLIFIIRMHFIDNIPVECFNPTKHEAFCSNCRVNQVISHNCLSILWLHIIIFLFFSVHRVIKELLICQQNTFIRFHQIHLFCINIYFSISTGKKFPTSLVLCYILNQQNSLHFPYKYQRFYPAPIVLSFFHHSNLQTTKLRNNKKAQTNRVTMEGAGRKQFFVVLIVLATMMLVTEAQIAPTPAPTSAPAPTEVSGGITTVPAFGAAATAVALLFGYLF